jgi:glycosyltransferase involved in cell wall biosynthesis
LSIRVGIDIRRAAWAPHVGISRYSRCLVTAMLSLTDRASVELVTLGLSHSKRYEGAASLEIGHGHHFVQRLIQEQTKMARASRRLDLLHLPWYEGPIRPRCPLVVNVHDLDTVESIGNYSLRFRAYYNTLLRIYARTARRIIVPSTATLDALKSRWPGGQYALVPYAVDPIFEQPPTSRDSTNVGDPYILYSGGFAARKGLSDLLDAFSHVADVDRDARLIIVGAAPPDFVRSVRRVNSRGRIELRGYVEDQELVALYRSARVVAYPSILEGFGFPVLEAFAVGTPVVATRAGSIPEIAGNAGLLVSPSKPTELAEALLAVIQDDQLADRLAVAGRERSRSYRWSTTATRTLSVYQAALA